MSTAALTVQRPSPESDTRPASPSSVGLACSAAAVRSSSQDEMTEPRRQSSATFGGVDVELVVLRLLQRGDSAECSACRMPASALSQDVQPSAKAAMMPYSMPLWTIFTKWPAPDGPQCR